MVYHDGASLYLDSTVHPTGSLWLGVDVARKRDLTVFWLNEQAADVHWTRAVMALQKAKFSTQRQVFDDLMAGRVRRGCIDANGVGAQLAEEAEERWSGRAEGVSLNGQVPGMIATKVKKVFEDRLIRIPDDAEIRKDLHQVRRTFTEAGNIRFEAPRTKDGHADRFWALGSVSPGGRRNGDAADRHGREPGRPRYPAPFLPGSCT
jgi:phage FluMu gp28-like protein